MGRDFSPLLFWFVNFLIKTRYGTHGISNFGAHHASQTLSFFELTFFQCEITFILEMLKCLVCFFCLELIFSFLKTAVSFPHDSCNALDLLSRKSLLSYIQKLLSYNALYFASGNLSFICCALLPWSTCLLLDN